jgi:hypothetical protein
MLSVDMKKFSKKKLKNAMWNIVCGIRGDQHQRIMKAIKILAIIFVLGTGLWMNPQKALGNNWFTYQVFYDGLSPYGTWVENPDYGFVWVPKAGPGFFPYATGGYWVLTSYGWTWVSDYPWGWATFHYGRWYYDRWYGWAWVPGEEWAPAWVTWRMSDGYFGWAPLMPGFTIYAEFGWNRYNIPPAHWCFVPDHYFGRRDMDRHYIPRNNNDRIYKRSSIIENSGAEQKNNGRYFTGPDTKLVRKTTGSEFRPVKITETAHPGQTIKGESMNIYRPEIKETAIRAERKTSPQKFVQYPEQTRKIEPAPVRKGRANVNEVKKEMPAVNENGRNRKIENSSYTGNTGKQQIRNENGRVEKVQPVPRANPGTKNPVVQNSRNQKAINPGLSHGQKGNGDTHSTGGGNNQGHRK